MPSRFARPSLALLLLSASGAFADEYSALMNQKKYAEALVAANAVLARDPDNPNALIAKARVIALQAPETRMDEAIALSEKCIAAHPANSACHEALGRNVGAKALMKGILASLGSAGTIRESFKTAVQLEPRNMMARFDLLQYYMQAPGIVGGGRDKAVALASETAKVNPDGGKLMLALIDLMEGRTAQAEAQALKVSAGGDNDIADMQRDVLLSAAWKQVQDKHLDDAIQRFREVQRRFPAADGAPFGIGVALQVQGKHQDALAMFQQASALAPSPEFDYFQGLSWQALHDNPKSILAFEKALASKQPGLKKDQRADAEKRLKDLKA
jgi:tetratricopeptide (TPR) repeat protein